jgi:DNA modification methylase
MKISELKPLEKNPFKSTGDEQIQKIADSIKSFEKMLSIRKIIIDENNQILGGNKRFFALKKLGYKNIPDEWIERVTGLTEAEKRGFIVKDNSHWGSEWDYEILSDWNVDLVSWGVPECTFESEPEVLEAKEDDFDVPEGGIETDIVLGDLFEIGEHRLLCGDSTDSDSVAKLMNGEKADMVFTDPPYKIETKGGARGSIGAGLRKQGKDIEFISNFEPSEFLQVLPLVFSKNMNAYIFCNKELLPDYLVWARDAGYSFNVLVWKKPNAIPIGDSHRPDIEYLLLFRKSAIWNNGLQDVNYSRCLEFGRESGLHPTMKPIELIENEIKISSIVSSIIFDFFLGSGSTMVAAHQLKRKCYGMELDPKYCQVIVDRMRKLDPTLVIKKNGIVI